MSREIVCEAVRGQILAGVPRGVDVDVISTKRRGLRVTIPPQVVGGKDISETELRGKNPARLARDATQAINEQFS